MRPFLLNQASQFGAEPPPPLDSNRYAKDLNETAADGALNSTVRTPAQTAIAYFWVGNSINQYNQTMQTVVAQHGLDLVVLHICSRWRNRLGRRGDRVLRLEVLLSRLASDHGDPERR